MTNMIGPAGLRTELNPPLPSTDTAASEAKRLYSVSRYTVLDNNKYKYKMSHHTVRVKEERFHPICNLTSSG